MESLARDLVAAALTCGATKAEVIPGDQVVLSADFAQLCAANACGQYRRCYMCPPDVGDIEELMTKVRGYSCALVYQTISELEDSYDWEGMQDASRNHANLSYRMREKVKNFLPPDSLHLTCGGCGLCDTCAKATGEPCRYPEDAMPSVESHGVDVYNTVRGTSLSYINGQNTVTFFGMVLYQR